MPNDTKLNQIGDVEIIKRESDWIDSLVHGYSNDVVTQEKGFLSDKVIVHDSYSDALDYAADKINK